MHRGILRTVSDSPLLGEPYYIPLKTHVLKIFQLLKINFLLARASQNNYSMAVKSPQWRTVVPTPGGSYENPPVRDGSPILLILWYHVVLTNALLRWKAPEQIANTPVTRNCKCENRRSLGLAKSVIIIKYKLYFAISVYTNMKQYFYPLFKLIHYNYMQFVYTQSLSSTYKDIHGYILRRIFFWFVIFKKFVPSAVLLEVVWV